jgi:GTP-binding protein
VASSEEEGLPLALAAGMEARFIISAARPEQFPGGSGDRLPEIAFLGRSNVGKSSLLNVLAGAGKGKLAFVSARPGCTQFINFYRIGDEFTFADLPGYGFAKVPVERKREWKRLIETYLQRREPLRLCILILDARRGWMEQDLELKQWLEFQGRRHIVVATKLDKLKSQVQERKGMEAIRAQYPEGELVPFSALTGRGAREIWQAIRKTKDKH